jgi:hypothetical protein
MKPKKPLLDVRKLLLFSLFLASFAFAGYEKRPWDIGPRENYPAFLTSEGVTIAVQPLFTDTMAGQVFDRDDIVTRGIMPLAVVIFNDNDFAVEVDGLSAELLRGDDRLRTITPNEAVYRLYIDEEDNVWTGGPMSKIPGDELNRDALLDFDEKFLISKVVDPHDKGGGFLYLHIPESEDIKGYLAGSLLYIPKIYRHDDGSRLIYFEIDVKPAVEAVPAE